MVLSIFLSLTLASIPGVFFFFTMFNNIDAWIRGIGWIFADLPVYAEASLGTLLPVFVYERFWFLLFFVPIALFSYSLFLGFTLGFFKLSRRIIPNLPDGFYPMETEDWLLYELFEVYYVLFPYFAWFFSVFLDTKPRHILFGAKIGSNTIIGNGRLFNPERTIIGDNCFFGYDAIVSGHVYEGSGLYLKEVVIGDRVLIGANAVVLPGAQIRDDVIVASNSTVPKDKVIPPNSIWINGKTVPRKAQPVEAELVRPGEAHSISG
jgi:acetyltransferase-like isoleucine patch superfamily enzyme